MMDFSISRIKIGVVTAFMLVSILALPQPAQANPSCTHGTNTHYHNGERNTTKYNSSHKHGTEHHHHGELVVAKNGSLFSSLYDRQCPRH